MSPEEELPHELKALEAELASLVPRSEGIDLGRVLYLAGRASAQRRAWAWPAAFAGATAVAVVLAVMLALRPAPETVERIVYVPAEVIRTPRDRDAAPSPRPVPSPPGPSGPAWSDESPALAAIFAEHRELTATEILRLPYPRFRNYLLTRGVDAWPQPPSGAADRSGGPRTYGDWQKTLLEKRS